MDSDEEIEGVYSSKERSRRRRRLNWIEMLKRGKWLKIR